MQASLLSMCYQNNIDYKKSYNNNVGNTGKKPHSQSRIVKSVVEIFYLNDITIFDKRLDIHFSSDIFCA